ncbi:hypothetical protein QFZ37_003564 [Chryseobacterium ginsenosidimutans]|uniref:hypothetical protein n=1 Tax=Chryseobacterium ginsenosidimutans TaxID=687846 RepID=UPI002786E9AE|nr:hypothetical protein [Chryseobacterium ginsenosidimutans]MDQ0595195.1 hypothetical protein [Chryseobacterium ginsenosidimutans]
MLFNFAFPDLQKYINFQIKVFYRKSINLVIVDKATAVIAINKVATFFIYTIFRNDLEEILNFQVLRNIFLLFI